MIHIFRHPLAALRLLYCSNEFIHVRKGVCSYGAHSDYFMLIALGVDSPGLTIHNNGQWLDIMFDHDKSETSSYKFVVNLGEVLERWINGKLKSTLCRVVLSNDESVNIRE